ncbi:MAG: hypothetical protein C1943_07105 [Halochromatium sp.]|nr:hypothetical protein [Halochromatium sp.]
MRAAVLRLISDLANRLPNLVALPRLSQSEQDDRVAAFATAFGTALTGAERGRKQPAADA